MIIRGSNQHDRTSRGDEIWSIPVHWVIFLCGKYVGSIHFKLIVAIRVLYKVMLVHRYFWVERIAVGRSMIVGRMTFNIVGGLSYGGGLSREFVWKLLVLLGRCLLRRPKM